MRRDYCGSDTGSSGGEEADDFDLGSPSMRTSPSRMADCSMGCSMNSMSSGGEFYFHFV